MEHLNRVCKDAIGGLKANKIPQALVSVGKVVGILDNVNKNLMLQRDLANTRGLALLEI